MTECSQCVNCKRKLDTSFDISLIHYLDTCLHVYCKTCLAKLINNQFVSLNGELKCRECSSPITSFDMITIIGQEQFNELGEQLLDQTYNIVKCVKCPEQFQFNPGQLSGNIKDAKGNVLSKQHEMNYVENRFVCLSAACKTEQCRTCKATPYHMGYNCEEYEKFQQSKRCRYCDQTIIKLNIKAPQALQDICQDDECQQKSFFACTQVKQCGHSCNGYQNEIDCLPCLQEKCAEGNEDLGGTTGDDYCNICFVEGLISAPCIRSNCGHIFHLECVTKRLQIKWISARINFNFCLCPLCQAWMEFPPDSALQIQMTKNLQLFDDIQNKALQRFKFEQRQKDEKLNNPKAPYYNKPTQYAIAIYSYFMCFKCQKPYFGGLKDCERGMEDDKKEFNPAELVCAMCCEIPTENCPKHGADFIEFKCKFCCSIAQWFCWGTTHFCEPCHQKQVEGDYVSQKPLDQLPKCTGREQCPLQIDHKPNGNQCALGCSLCRNQKQNAREY